jgi:hypothetical protein
MQNNYTLNYTMVFWLVRMFCGYVSLPTQTESHLLYNKGNKHIFTNVKFIALFVIEEV